MIVRVILLTLLLTLIAFWIVRRIAPGALRGWKQVLPFWLFALAIQVAWFLVQQAGHGQAGAFGTAVKAIASSWTIAVLACVLVGGSFALVRAVAARWKRRSPQAVDLDRRRFLGGGVAIPVASLGTGAGGTLAGLGSFVIRKEEVAIEGLPEGLDGFRIGQITDVHIGDFIDTDLLLEAVQAMNAAGCDLQVMTGDLIDDLTRLEATFDALENNDAPHGMLAILGNHEIWRGRDAVVEGYERRAPGGRLRLLVDESVRIEHRGASLRIVGVDYPMLRGGKHRIEREQRDQLMERSAARGFASAQAGETLLCLTHHPDFFPFAAERGAALTLAGHTHGGQFAIFGYPVFRFAYDYMLGRYRRGAAHLYVSGGTGHWLPWRIGVPTEVTILTLRGRARQS